MRAAIFCALFACIFQTCIADEKPQIEKISALQADENSGMQVSVGDGVTNVTINSFHVKITAQQRMQDNMVQVIAFPLDQGVQFRIEGVNFVQGTQGASMSGWTAQVHGVFIFPTNNQTMARVSKTVPVQLTMVDQFTVSSDEAQFQGNPCVEQPLPQ